MKRFTLILVYFLISIPFTNAQECLDVKFKLRGYFYAGTSIIDSAAAGGFYEDKNRPKKIDKNLGNLFTSKKLIISVQKDSLLEFEKNISGFKVLIVNKTDSIIRLPAQDSRLYLKRQVFYNGKWRDMEYIPNSWCGNSYHDVFIKPNEYWDLSAPCIQGKIEAKFRFELYVNKTLNIYSDEFKGSFNKSQLKKEQGHKPLGLMDPYNN